LEKCGKASLEVFCASQTEVSSHFVIGESNGGAFQPTFQNGFFHARGCNGAV
jgi:hypothetical protein